jgi:hypothetical protein
MKRRKTPREVELANVLLVAWEAANGALADVQRGHASFTMLAETLQAIAEDAAEALAALPACYTTPDEA